MEDIDGSKTEGHSNNRSFRPGRSIVNVNVDHQNMMNSPANDAHFWRKKATKTTPITYNTRRKLALIPDHLFSFDII